MAPTVRLHCNGKPLEIVVPSRATLADALRSAGRTGTRLGCEHGVCGTCTVLLDGTPTRSCLTLALQADGREVETIEGLADDDGLHPVQQAFHDHRGLQCGFCTPGFVMLAVGLLREEPDASEQRVREVLASNLCRCTGYASIVAAVRSVQDDAR